MKKIPKNESICLSPVKLYWDELEELYERLAKGRVTITLKSGDFSYESLEELREKTKKSYIENIEITGRDKDYKNYINLRIDPGEVQIMQDTESTETAAKLKDILKGRSPWYMYSPNSSYWFIATNLFAWIAAIIIPSLIGQLGNAYLLLISFPISMGIILWVFAKEPIIGRSKIFTTTKKDRLNFFERNKDDLVKGLIIAVFSFILGKFAG